MGCNAQSAFRIRTPDWSYDHGVAALDERTRFAELAANTLCWLWTWVSAAYSGCVDRDSQSFLLRCCRRSPRNSARMGRRKGPPQSSTA